MAWNQPGGKKDGNDPWSGKRPSQGSSNLDEALRKLKRKIYSLFGKKSGTGSNRPVKPGRFQSISFSILIAALFLIWGISGIYVVSPGQVAVVLRFGKYIGIAEPGPHWSPHYIEEYHLINLQHRQKFDYSTRLLTQDNNLVDVRFRIQYQIIDAEKFWLTGLAARSTLEQTVAAITQQKIGRLSMDNVLYSDNQNAISNSIQTNLQQTINQYGMGMQISQVDLISATPPADIKTSFDEALKAHNQDEKRTINEANDYGANIKSVALAQAEKIREFAEAERQELVFTAKGDIAEYNALLTEYQRAPALTKERIYIETLESVFNNNKKIFIDQKGNSVINVPLNKLERSLALPFTLPATHAMNNLSLLPATNPPPAAATPTPAAPAAPAPAAAKTSTTNNDNSEEGADTDDSD